MKISKNSVKYLITDIEYDKGHDELPQSLIMTVDHELDQEELEIEASEFISNETGFCHKGFCVELKI